MIEATLAAELAAASASSLATGNDYSTGRGGRDSTEVRVLLFLKMKILCTLLLLCIFFSSFPKLIYRSGTYCQNIIYVGLATLTIRMATF